MRYICPICHKKMEREKWWFEKGQLRHGCVFCYMNYREEYMKKKNNIQDDGNDDIL